MAWSFPTFTVIVATRRPSTRPPEAMAPASAAMRSAFEAATGRSIAFSRAGVEAHAVPLAGGDRAVARADFVHEVLHVERET